MNTNAQIRDIAGIPHTHGGVREPEVTSGNMTLGELFDRAISCVTSARTAYLEFSRKFSRSRKVATLWRRMSNEEDIQQLMIYRAMRSLPRKDLEEPADPKLIGRLILAEKVMSKIDINNIHNMKEAYALAHDFEYSEINNVFEYLITSSDRAVGIENVFFIGKDHLNTLHELGRYSQSNYRRTPA